MSMNGFATAALQLRLSRVLVATAIVLAGSIGAEEIITPWANALDQ